MDALQPHGAGVLPRQALAEYLSARDCTKDILNFQCREEHDNEMPWTLTHSHFANMGGFFLKFESEPIDPDMAEAGDKTSKWIKEVIDNCQAGYAGLGLFAWAPHKSHYEFVRQWLNVSQNSNGVDRYSARLLAGDVWVLTATQLLQARKDGIIKKFPKISEREINDKNKGDAIVKLLAVIQVLWLGIQLAIRAAMGRQSSQIEITALAFAVCASITYLLLLRQPKDVSMPFVIHADRNATYEEFTKIVTASKTIDGLELHNNYIISTFSHPSSNSDHTRQYWNLQCLGIFGGLSVFGAIHLIAWNFQYPNEVERLLWRISALMVTLLPPIVGVFNSDLVPTSWVDAGWIRRVTYFTLGLSSAFTSFILFPTARIYLLVEAFRSTYYLPPTTYVATWANNIPHIG